MILGIFLNVIYLILTSVFSFLPEVTIASIPYIGTLFRSFLVSAVSIWQAFLITFPYAQTAWFVFLYVILPFEALMLLAKFLLGHRLPAHNTN